MVYEKVLHLLCIDMINMTVCVCVCVCTFNDIPIDGLRLGLELGLRVPAILQIG